MSILKNIFGSTNETPKTPKLSWNQLTDLGQLNEIIDVSTEKPALIFKHSTRCSISRMALKNFENEYSLEDKIALYFLDLLEFRSISNEIETRFSVPHQSPQVLLIKDGKAIYSASHSDILADDLINKI